MSVQVSVIIPMHKQNKMTIRCLELLLHQVSESLLYEIIVVDNNPTENSITDLRQMASRHSNLRILDEPIPGAGAARNTGINAAQGELLIFLDDDIYVLPDHIQQHWQFHLQQTVPHCLVVQVQDQATITDCSALQSYVRARQATTTRKPASTQSVGMYLAAGNFSIPRSFIKTIRFKANGRYQYFDETFIKRQDGELGYRLEKAGVSFFFSSQIQARHSQTYTRHSFIRRAYLSGYFLQKIFAKHSDARQTIPSKNTKSSTINRLLLIISKTVYPLGVLLRFWTPWLLHKAVGMQLLYHSNRGYQDAYYDRAPYP